MVVCQPSFQPPCAGWRGYLCALPAGLLVFAMPPPPAKDLQKLLPRPAPADPRTTPTNMPARAGLAGTTACRSTTAAVARQAFLVIFDPEGPQAASKSGDLMALFSGDDLCHPPFLQPAEQLPAVDRAFQTASSTGAAVGLRPLSLELASLTKRQRAKKRHRHTAVTPIPGGSLTWSPQPGCSPVACLRPLLNSPCCMQSCLPAAEVAGETCASPCPAELRCGYRACTPEVIASLLSRTAGEAAAALSFPSSLNRSDGSFAFAHFVGFLPSPHPKANRVVARARLAALTDAHCCEWD